MIINYQLPHFLSFQKKKLLYVFCFIVIMLLAKHFFLEHYLSLTYFHTHLSSLQRCIAQHYYLALFLYSLAYSTAAACALPGSSCFMIIAGLFFHTVTGTLIALMSATVGAACLFFIMRSLFGQCVQKRFAHRIAGLNQEIIRYGHYYLLMVRFAALIPFGMTNVLAACTPIPLFTFIWTTAIGIIPVTLLCTYIGEQLCSLPTPDYTYSQFFVAVSLSFMFRIVIVPWLYSRLKYHKKSSTYV